jgi:DNA-directed RNA polymerase specialized sigma24 family protein
MDSRDRYKRKYLPTPEIDAAIRDAYQKQRQGDRKALRAVAAKIGWARNAVCKRGAELGVTRAKELPWSAAEEELLERFGHLAPSGIRRQLATAGFSRSIAAIQIRLNRTRIKQNLDGYSATRLANALGVDVHKILTWIRRGLLAAERRGTERTQSQGGDMWWISDRSVKRFILRAPDEIDLARVEKIWFLDLLTGGKILNQRLCA